MHVRVLLRVVLVCDAVVVQIVEHSVIGTRSSVLRLRRPGTELQFVVFPMFHVASPRFYAEVSERLRRCDLLVVEGSPAAQRWAGPSRPPIGSSRPTSALAWWRTTFRTVRWVCR
ncbi:hypothetical protein Pflav_014550 [Phytohabitans flavus]|uniref:Uncharacterized protein n=1 Tax=Phytohabitans flavus TaxID=1076124 RepID=A0A6F8XMK9_9ACTN|nr:hypothetical protein Pflav_014550 [Phytohabitans flavus]